MGDAPDIHALSERLAVLEERMNTHQATYETALERNNAAFERLRADMAARETALSERIATASDRNATARWWQTGAILAGIAVAAAVIIAVI